MCLLKIALLIYFKEKREKVNQEKKKKDKEKGN